MEKGEYLSVVSEINGIDQSAMLWGFRVLTAKSKLLENGPLIRPGSAGRLLFFGNRKRVSISPEGPISSVF